MGMNRPIGEVVEHAAFSHELLPGADVIPGPDLLPISGEPDEHGNVEGAWLSPVQVGIFAFDPGSTSEPRLPGQDRVVVEPTVYLPAGVVFGPQDLVRVRGLLYEVDGITREWVHPFDSARRAGVATLRRVTG